MNGGPVSQKNNPAVGIGFMLASMFLFAGMDAISRHITQTFSVGQILAIRFVFFMAFAILLTGPRNLPTTVKTRNLPLQLIRGAQMVLEIGVFVWALRFVPLADVHSIAAAAPLVVVALAGPILGEKVGWHRWAAVLTGFVGVLIIMRPGFREMDFTVILPLVATLLWGAAAADLAPDRAI